MVRKYTVTAFTEAENAFAGLPSELASVIQRYPFAGLQAYAWTFGENSFDRIPKLRDALKERSPPVIEETGRRDYSEADSKQADLLLLTGGELSGAEVVEDHSLEHRRCAACGFVVARVREKPKLLVSLPDEPLPGIFWLRGADLVIASEPAWRKLEQACLTKGLSTFAIRTTAGRDESYLGLYATAALDWPAAPFGYNGTLCATCGRPVRRSLDAADRRVYPGLPRYSFYLVFEHPPEYADWMWTEVHGQTSLIVSAAVRDWFAKSGETIRGSSGRANEFHFLALGWFPEEAGSAFLPEQYHETSAPDSGTSGGIARARAAVDRFLGDSNSGNASNQSSAAAPADPATRMFAAWSGQDRERVGRDPQALLAGLRAVGEDVREILRDAVSGDPARHARAEARLAELRRWQAEAGLAGEVAPEAAGASGSDDDPDSPGARFRGRLQTILEEAVGRLERLNAEVGSDRQDDRNAPDGDAPPSSAPGPREGPG